jgi:hypothetical protein
LIICNHIANNRSNKRLLPADVIAHILSYICSMEVPNVQSRIPERCFRMFRSPPKIFFHQKIDEKLRRLITGKQKRLTRAINAINSSDIFIEKAKCVVPYEPVNSINNIKKYENKRMTQHQHQLFERLRKPLEEHYHRLHNISVLEKNMSIKRALKMKIIYQLDACYARYKLMIFRRKISIVKQASENCPNDKQIYRFRLQLKEITQYGSEKWADNFSKKYETILEKITKENSSFQKDFPQLYDEMTNLLAQLHVLNMDIVELEYQLSIHIRQKDESTHWHKGIVDRWQDLMANIWKKDNDIRKRETRKGARKGVRNDLKNNRIKSMLDDFPPLG